MQFSVSAEAFLFLAYMLATVGFLIAAAAFAWLLEKIVITIDVSKFDFWRK